MFVEHEGFILVERKTPYVKRRLGLIIAIDLDDRRLTIAQTNGAKYILNPIKENILDETIKITEGYGVDSVIITAATSSNEPLAQAFQMCRKKGRVILVGVVGMEINREDMYKKELDFYISTSYGPGRYDPNYEEKGIDYPYHYVRWTENRNMKEYLKMLIEGKIKLNNIRRLRMMKLIVENDFNDFDLIPGWGE